MPTSARYNRANKVSRVLSLFQAGKVEDDLQYADIRKNRRKEFREGTHSQQDWRVKSVEGTRQKVTGAGANLGAMGELGDDVVIYISMGNAYKEIMNMKIIKKSWLLNTFKRLVYTPLKRHLLAEINAWVPSDSDTLRKAIAKSITQRGGSQLKGFPFLVMLNSRGVKYGKPVNKMPTSWLKHGGAGDVHALLGRRTKSRHDGHVLSDKKAISGFYNWILMSGRKKAEKLFPIFRRALFKKLKESELDFFYTGRELSNIAGGMLIPHYNNQYAKG